MISEGHAPATLKRLELAANGITASSAPGLGDALHPPSGDGSTLAYLELSGNELGDEGAKVIAAALKHNTALTHVTHNSL